MSNHFKILFRSGHGHSDLSVPQWEYGCPLEVEAVQLIRNTIDSTCYLQVRLLNVCPDVISNVNIKANIARDDGESFSIDITKLDLDLQPSKSKALDPIPLEFNRVRSASVMIESLQFQRGSEWVSSADPSEYPKGPPLHLSANAIAGRRLLLESMGVTEDLPLREPIVESNWWLCPCGQVNVRRQRCLSCGIDRDNLREIQNQGNLERIYENEESRELLVRKKRKRVILITTISVVVAIAIGIAVILYNEYIAPYTYDDQTAYEYIRTHASEPDDLTFYYAKKLSDEDYQLSKEIYQDIIPWNAEVYLSSTPDGNASLNFERRSNIYVHIKANPDEQFIEDVQDSIEIEIEIAEDASASTWSPEIRTYTITEELNATGNEYKTFLLDGNEIHDRRINSTLYPVTVSVTKVGSNPSYDQVLYEQRIEYNNS